jgi:hypothetical protein
VCSIAGLVCRRLGRSLGLRAAQSGRREGGEAARQPESLIDDHDDHAAAVEYDDELDDEVDVKSDLTNQ